MLPEISMLTLFPSNEATESFLKFIAEKQMNNKSRIFSQLAH
ncbi:hypothetical protein M127_5368 [Bacteroides fragilis str. S6L5]|nr:hypothetical protein M127_5368 [Bacteroides fragilis str. S6L5]